MEEIRLFTPSNALVVDTHDEDLLRRLDEEEWRPYTLDDYLDLFKPENGYKFSHINENDKFDPGGQLHALTSTGLSVGDGRYRCRPQVTLEFAQCRVV
jgi:hypothetical protein